MAAPMNPRGTVPQVWPLAGVAAVVILLTVTGVVPPWSGLVHLVGLPPLDLFADLRLLLTRTTSVPSFLALLVLVAAVRICVLALLLGGLTHHRLRFAALFYAAAFPLLLLAATIDFASYAVLYSRLFWPAVALVAVVVLVAGPAPWQRAEDTRLRTGLGLSLRRGLRLEVMVPYAAVVVGLGAVADLTDGWVSVALVPVSALATAAAISALARPVAGRPLRRLAVAAIVAVLVGAALVTTRTVAPAPPAEARPGSLFIMSGINSSSGSGSIFETDVEALGYACDQVYYFSYAGTGDGAPQGDATCPIRTGEPYQPDDTLRPVAEQVDLFAAQVRDLPRPLVVASHSLAAWVAWEAVATGRAPQVDVLVLVGPFPDSPVGFPPAGSDGAGRVAGDLLRLLTPLAEAGDFHFDPEAPAARELLATPNAASEVFGRPLPERVRTVSITSATDLPLMPGGWRLPVERNACPVREAHPYLPETPALYHEVNRFLDRAPPLPCPRWRDWGAPAARPFGVPPAAV
jgi:hypothetical protein